MITNESDNIPKEVQIKAIVFDLGGVVFTSGTHLTLAKLVERYHINDRESLEIFFKSKPYNEGGLLRLGDISMDEFEKRFFLKFKINENSTQVLRNIWFSTYLPYFSMFRILKMLNKKYRLIAFSGNIKERIIFLDSRYDFLKFFHKTLFSYDYHYLKTDREFYNILIAHLHCKPSETLLIDDSFEVIEIARSLGFHTLLFLYSEQLIKELSFYGVIISLELLDLNSTIKKL
ncbi:MAG: HAD family hydrolase [Promethearchaeota archaeon]